MRPWPADTLPVSITLTVPCVAVRAAAVCAAAQVPLTRLDRLDRDHRAVVRTQEFELTTEIARRWLRRLRRLGAALDLGVELLRRDAHLVEVAAVAEVHANRDHVDVEPVEFLVRDVRRAVRDDRDAAVGRVRRVLLALHVVGFFARYRAELPRHAEHLGGIVDVNVHAHLALQAGDDEAAADRRQLLAQVPAIDPLAGDDALRAVTIDEVLVAAAGGQLVRRAVDDRRRAAGRFILRAAFEVVGDALDEFDETLRAGVDHVRLAQHFELERGLLERRAGCRDAVTQDRAEVLEPVLARFLHGVREGREHREDRALARFAEAVAGVLGAAAHAFRKIGRVDPGEVAHAIAEAEEELREDRAGIAARAIERRVGHARERLAGVAGRATCAARRAPRSP